MVFSSFSWHRFCLILLLHPQPINRLPIKGKGRGTSRDPKAGIPKD
jgi:hypothetical protein